jgi:hypothetical protein
MLMIYETGPKGRSLNRWTVSPSDGKPIAEISLKNGEFTVHPLKKLTKDESSHVAGCLDFWRNESYGDPPKGSIEAILERVDADLHKCADIAHDQGDSRLERKLDGPAGKLDELREALRLQRGESQKAAKTKKAA